MSSRKRTFGGASEPVINRLTDLPWAALLVLAGLVAFTLLVFFRVTDLEQIETRLRFEQTAADRLAAIERQYRLSMAAVDLVGTLFDTRPLVTEAEFRRFVEPILARNPALSALSFAPLVGAADRVNFEIQAGYHHEGFRITERVLQGEMKAADEREAYVPVRYIVPLEGNESALGFDLASVASRRTALMHARRDGQMRATSPIVLVQETGAGFSFLLVRPVYPEGTVPETAAERIRALTGYVTAVVRADGLIASALEQLLPGGVNFRILDLMDGAGPRELGTHYSRTRSETQASARSFPSPESIAFTSEFAAAGRRYLFEAAAVPGVFAAGPSAVSWLLLAAGLASSFAAAGFLWLLQSSGRRLRDGARAMQDLSRRLIRVREQERQRLSMHLHEEVGQTVAALKLSLHSLNKSSDDGSGSATAGEALADRILNQLREISLDLRPPMLDDLGLNAALQWYLRRQAERAGVALDYRYDPAIGRLPDVLETTAYRLVQDCAEALIRSGDSDRLSVHVGSAEGRLLLEIECDRVAGKDEDSAQFDLESLSRIAELAGGNLHPIRADNSGLGLRASIPLYDSAVSGRRV